MIGLESRYRRKSIIRAKSAAQKLICNYSQENKMKCQGMSALMVDFNKSFVEVVFGFALRIFTAHKKLRKRVLCVNNAMHASHSCNNGFQLQSLTPRYMSGMNGIHEQPVHRVSRIETRLNLSI